MDTMKNRNAVLAHLDGLGIAYTLLEHAPAHTIDDCLLIEGIDFSNTEIPRNAFLAPATAMRSPAFSSTAEPALRRAYLAERPGLRFTLMLLRHDVPFKTAVVSRALGVSRLSFAPQDVLPELLGLEAGAVSPFGLIFDSEKRVDLILDTGLEAYERLAMHPCDNTATVVLRREDFLNTFLPSIGRTARWVNPVAEDAERGENRV